jgi:hypothetical protein
MAQPSPGGAKIPAFVPLDIYCAFCSISSHQLGCAEGFVHAGERWTAKRLTTEKDIDHKA